MSPSKFYPFSDYDRKQIAKLPPDIAALADKYPSEILNTADSWDNLPFDANYFPECLEVYSGDADDANIFVLNGVLKDYVPADAEKNTSSITVMIDGEFAYIEVATFLRNWYSLAALNRGGKFNATFGTPVTAG